MEKILVNHVMSNTAESSIFNSILDYFMQYSPDNFEYVKSVNPIEGADVYHYHRPHLEKKLKANSVCTVHHDLNDPDPWHAKFRFIPRYVEAQSIICLNKTQKNILLEQGLDENKLYVIPHGYNPDILSLKTNNKFNDIEQQKITLGLASRRYGRRVKGEAYLLELAKRLDPDYFNFIFVGQDRTISAIAMRKLGYEAIAYERLPYRIFQSFYNEIDILLICSSHEGGPANVPEALATGTPIFSSKIGMPKDVIKDGENGIFLTLDPDVDAEKIMDICVHEPYKLSNIILNAREMNKLTFSWKECIQENLSVYKTIANINK